MKDDIHLDIVCEQLAYTQLPTLNISMISLMNSTDSNGPISMSYTLSLHIFEMYN